MLLPFRSLIIVGLVLVCLVAWNDNANLLFWEVYYAVKGMVGQVLGLCAWHNVCGQVGSAGASLWRIILAGPRGLH